MSSYNYFLYSKKRIVPSSLFAGVSAAFVGSGLAVSVFPSLATIPPATAAALIALGAVLTVGFFYGIASSIAGYVNERATQEASLGRPFKTDGAQSDAVFWSYTDMFLIAVAAASTASAAVLMPHWLLLAGANSHIVAGAAHPAMRFALPTVLLVCVWGLIQLALNAIHSLFRATVEWTKKHPALSSFLFRSTASALPAAAAAGPIAAAGVLASTATNALGDEVKQVADAEEKAAEAELEEKLEAEEEELLSGGPKI